MGKILFWVVVILVALVAARMIARNNARPETGAAPKRAASSKNGAPLQDEAESMVRCEHCGIHLPRSEALLQNGRTWCGQEHAKLGEKAAR